MSLYHADFNLKWIYVENKKQQKPTFYLYYPQSSHDNNIITYPIDFSGHDNFWNGSLDKLNF